MEKHFYTAHPKINILPGITFMLQGSGVVMILFWGVDQFKVYVFFFFNRL